MKYPTEKDAVFTIENDHNPLIQKRCSRCNGYGKVDISSKELGEREAWTLMECPECKGKKVVAGAEKYFSNEGSPMEAKINSDGWLKCPNCGKSFSTKDKDRWTGLRHKSCGQKIHVIES